MTRLATREAVKARQDEGAAARARPRLDEFRSGRGTAGGAGHGAPDSGVDDSATSRAVVPLVGARELVHAAGLLTSRRKSVWAWTRVVGDAMDLTSLAMAIAHPAGVAGGGASVSPAPSSGSRWWTC